MIMKQEKCQNDGSKKCPMISEASPFRKKCGGKEDMG
jgi:hypothetical protein